MDKDKASEARRGIRRGLTEVERLAERILKHRDEVTPGKVTTILRKCGKPGCRCARGERHPTQYLYVTRGGALKRLYVPKKDLAGVRDRSERYGALRKLRAELNKAFAGVLAAVDALEAALTERYEKGVRQEVGDE
jgi:hypothetical protein